ncbi:MAG TPA: SCO family protein [Bryobacteraceae bacterium]|jgi:protein SCO1/2|nr:SCO family protein [Bryobacteraceae bacterium]
MRLNYRNVLFACAILLAGCAQRSRLDNFGQLQPFHLTSQTGQAFDSKSLEGHVWVADFFFTSCPGPCPLMSKKLGELQRQTADLPDVKIVSFTVDPATDTPAVLTSYAKHFNADPARWFFLTGDQAALTAVGRDGFKLNPVDGSTVHSTRFALVDQHMQIRGYYSSDEDGFLPKLIRDVRSLEGGST